MCAVVWMPLSVEWIATISMIVIALISLNVILWIYKQPNTVKKMMSASMQQ